MSLVSLVNPHSKYLAKSLSLTAIKSVDNLICEYHPLPPSVNKQDCSLAVKKWVIRRFGKLNETDQILFDQNQKLLYNLYYIDCETILNRFHIADAIDKGLTFIPIVEEFLYSIFFPPCYKLIYQIMVNLTVLSTTHTFSDLVNSNANVLVPYLFAKPGISINNLKELAANISPPICYSFIHSQILSNKEFTNEDLFFQVFSDQLISNLLKTVIMFEKFKRYSMINKLFTNYKDEIQTAVNTKYGIFDCVFISQNFRNYIFSETVWQILFKYLPLEYIKDVQESIFGPNQIDDDQVGFEAYPTRVDLLVHAVKSTNPEILRKIYNPKLDDRNIADAVERLKDEECAVTEDLIEKILSGKLQTLQ